MNENIQRARRSTDLTEKDFVRQRDDRLIRLWVFVAAIFAVLVACFYFLSTAHAANNDVTVTWSAPWLYTDATPISDPIVYTVYKDGVKVAGNITVLTYIAAAQPAGNACWTITSTVAGEESDPSASNCHTVPMPAPSKKKPTPPFAVKATNGP